MNLSSHKRGFTLLEVLIAITVFVIFLAATMNAYFAIADAAHRANNMRTLYSAGQDILTTLSEDIRKGTVDFKCYADASPRPKEAFPRTGLGKDTFCRDNKLKGLNDLVIRQGDRRTVYRFAPPVAKDAAGTFSFVKHYRDTSIQEKWLGATTARFQNVADFKNWELPTGITIKDLRFRVTPYQNPFFNVDDTRAQFHPEVTIVLTMHSESISDGYTLPLQTTISSRVYDKLDY